MRVVVVMPVSSPWSRLLAVRLAELGATVDVVDFSPADVSNFLSDADGRAALQELESKVHRVHRVETPRAFPLHVAAAARALRRIARRAEADVVLTLYGGTSALVAYLSGVRPYMVYVVGSDVLLANLPRRLASRVTFARAARVLANGEHLAARARDMAPGATVQPLYLGIDLKRFQPRREAPTPTFVCTRVFRPIYDNATIIRALGALRGVPDGFSMTFLSAGPLLADAVRLADEVVPRAWRDRVTFAGWTSDDALNEALRTASFYLSASLSDGTSSSLLEAMATGLLPIVSDIPANREWITHGENGLLFPPGDHRALACCLERALAGEPWMASAIDANFRLVAGRANVDVTMTRLFDWLRAEQRPQEAR